MSVMDKIQKYASEMIGNDHERDTELFQKVDEHWKSIWDLPKPLKDLQWIRAVKSTDPHDELLAATRMFANKREIVHFNPYDESVKSHEVANRIEKSLAWNMYLCNRRRKMSVRWDYVLSSLKYNAIAAQVDYLPYRKKIKGIAQPRDSALKLFGDFNVIVHNPQFVHAEYSDAMLERVVTNRTVSTRKAVDFWGKDRFHFGDDEPDEITIYDFLGFVDGKLKRGVWYGSSADAPLDKNVILNADKKEGDYDLPFINWIIAFGGTSLESDPRHMYNPLLYSVVNAGQVETQNIIKTLVLSEAVSHAAAPRYQVAGPGSEEVEVNYGDPSGRINTPIGVTVTPLPPPPADESLLKYSQLFQSEMDKGTVSGLLQGSTGLGGTAGFATWNLVLQHNLSAILQYKEQAEIGLADTYTMMLLWPHSQGRELTGYGLGKKDKGKKYTVTPQDYKPEDLHIEVELIPDLPTNRGQQVNTAVMLHREFNIAEERLLEELGYNDPEELQRKRFFERKLDTLRQAEERKVIGEVDLDLQLKGQMQARQLAGPTPQQLPLAGKPPGFPEQLAGEGMNPAMGGTPPQMMFPEGTRETQTGETTTGEEIETP